MIIEKVIIQSGAKNLKNWGGGGGLGGLPHDNGKIRGKESKK